MSEAPPPLPPKKGIPRWKLAILWGLPAAVILLMLPVGFYWMYVTKGEKAVLILSVFGVIQIALLCVLAEINGRLKASTLPVGGSDSTAVRRFHSRLYFVVQLIVGPLLAFALSWVLGALVSM